MSTQSRAIESCDFTSAALNQEPVNGHTHNLYKYPARFSPTFAKAAIERFTEPGGVVLDPFVGGGTTLIESRLSGRNALGSDISSLAVFVTRTKTIPLSKSDLIITTEWHSSAIKRMNIHRTSPNSMSDKFSGYDRNMPWRLRKVCEQYLEDIDTLPHERQRRFIRCVLLRCGQWAMDCRKNVPDVDSFRIRLQDLFEKSVNEMRDYRKALHKVRQSLDEPSRTRCVQAPASNLSQDDFGKLLSPPADMILTSPPYPGVHVLYHRWNVRGRRETPAPFWIADCMDGHGGVHYTIGDRRQEGLKDYFGGIQKSFGNLRPLLKDDGLVVQVVAFSCVEWQLDAYLQAMSDAGYHEVFPNELDIKVTGRLWRPVPGRRWYSAIRGNIPSSNEVVLFHRKA